MCVCLQVGNVVLSSASKYYVCQEHNPLLCASVCSQVFQPASKEPLQSGLHPQLLHGPPAANGVSVFVPSGLCSHQHNTIYLLWTIQV